MRSRLVFASIILPGRVSEINSLLFVKSIREFGGSLSSEPIWCFFQDDGYDISEDVKDRLFALDVHLIPFTLKNQFPFMHHAQTAALAESRALKQSDLLVWLATNTIIIQEPNEYLISEDKTLGYRPVHHALIGSKYSEKLDSFWKLVYEHCKVPNERIFPMKPHIEDFEIRPYFNAGSLVVRPRSGVFNEYYKSFLSIYQNNELKKFYQQNELYAIFIHQAVLSGTILSKVTLDELVELSPTYNYPVHLHTEDTKKTRPRSMEDCVTFRHEGFHTNPHWTDTFPAGDSLKHWLKRIIDSVKKE